MQAKSDSLAYGDRIDQQLYQFEEFADNRSGKLRDVHWYPSCLLPIYFYIVLPYSQSFDFFLAVPHFSRNPKHYITGHIFLFAGKKKLQSYRVTGHPSRQSGILSYRATELREPFFSGGKKKLQSYRVTELRDPFFFRREKK